MSHIPSSVQIESFYDEFLASRMLGYRLHSNLRMKAAIQRVQPYVSSNHIILDIGCGIGIISEAISKMAPGVQVWACDISERNIWYAQKVVRRPNVQFRQIDVNEDFSTILEWIGGPVDVITLVDVIEHIPISNIHNLFAQLTSLLSETGVLVLTYPSPYYQEYLRESKPHELQIVDEIIYPEMIFELATQNQLSIKHYSLRDIWLTNQYVHCVLGKDTSLVATDSQSTNFMIRVWRYFRNKIDRYFLLPMQKRRYIHMLSRRL